MTPTESDWERYDDWRAGKVDRLAALERFKNCRNCAWANHLPLLGPTRTEPAEDELFKCLAKEDWSISGHQLDMHLKDNAWGCHLWDAKQEEYPF